MENLPFDMTYHFDETLRPRPNNREEMAAGVEWLIKGVADLSGSECGRQLGLAGIYAAMIGELDRGEALLLAAIDNVPVESDPRQRHVLELRLGQVYQWQERYGEGDALFARAIRECRNQPILTDYLDFALQHAGKCAFDQALYQRACDCFEEALALRKNKGDQGLIDSTEFALAVTRCRMLEESKE